jgi:hypothetical protein
MADDICYSITAEDRSISYVSISLTAKAQAKPSPEDRIVRWFKCHALPRAGTIVRIPDYHFDPRYF